LPIADCFDQARAPYGISPQRAHFQADDVQGEREQLLQTADVFRQAASGL
jgi:hypothetical protein